MCPRCKSRLWNQLRNNRQGLRPSAIVRPTDPPMRRSAGSVVWFESGPEPILEDPRLATIIVKVGMASNAINSIMLVARAVSRRRRTAAKTRDSLAIRDGEDELKRGGEHGAPHAFSIVALSGYPASCAIDATVSTLVSA